MLVGRIREQLNLFHRRRAVQSAELNQARHRPIEQRRVDRTFADRKKFVRAEPEVSQRESEHGSHLQPRPVAIIPRRRPMQPNLSRQFNLRDPPQRLAQNSSFELQLPLVGDVLIMASATLAEIRTASFDAIRRRFDQPRNRAARESRLLLLDLSLNFFSRQNKRHKHRHAAPIRTGRRACQSVTAVDQLFDGKKHGVRSAMSRFSTEN